MLLNLKNRVNLTSQNQLKNSGFGTGIFAKMSLFMSLAAWPILMSAGCGESKTTTADPKSDPTPAAVSALSTNGASTNATSAANPVAAGQQSEVANETESFDKLNGTVPVEKASEKKVSQTASSSTAAKTPPAEVKAVAKVQPTAAQLSAWKSNNYEDHVLLKLIDSKEAGFLSRVVALPDGKSYVLSGTKLTMWSIDQDTAPIHVFIDLSKEENNSIKSIDVSADGKLLVASDSHGKVSVFDIGEKKELVSKQLSKSSFADMVLSPDSQEVATLGYGSEVGIWKITDLSAKKQFEVNTTGVKQLDYVTIGVLAVAGEDTSTWDTTSGKKLAQLSPGRYHASLSLSADGSTFSFADEAGLKFIKTSDSSPEGEFPGNFAMDESVRFAPEGSLVATVSGSMIRIWDRSAKKLDQVIDDAGSLLVDASWSPKSNLLLSASVDGRVGVWGTPTSRTALGLQPLHQKIQAAADVPASSELLLQEMDLRVFPRYPQSQLLMENETSLSYTISAPKEDIETFCRYLLQERGWQEKADPNAMPGSIAFYKDGFTVTAAVTDMTATERNVSLTFLGNYDLRKAPRPASIKPEIVYENENVVIFKSKASLPTIETELLRAMHAAGWTAFARLNSSHSEQPDGRDFEFLNAGTTLRVMVGKYPTDPDKYSIQYSRFVSLHALPIPTDSGYVEFDGSVSPFLVANTKMNFQGATAFYDEQMTKNGWLVRNRDRHIDEKKICWLPYTRGAESVGIALAHLADGRTQILVGQKLENTSWQVEKRQSSKEEKPPVVGIEAADIPIPSGAENVKYDVDDKSINFDITANSLADITNAFTKELTALGWEAEDSGVRSDEYVLATYTKDKAEVEWRATMRQGTAVVSVQGDGLLWTKAQPGSNTVISYEAWQRRNKRLAGLEGIDAYLKEMKAIESAAK